MLIKEYKYLKQPVDGLATFFKKEGSMATMVLYNPSKILTAEDFKNKTDWLVGGIKTLHYKLKDKNCNFHSVTTSFARKGYGPFVYDLMFSFLNDYIAPDRNSVSEKAKNLWNYIFKNRSNEFDIQPIKSKTCLHGFNPYEPEEYVPEEEYVDQIYKLQSPLDYSHLSMAHQNFLELARDKFGYSADVTEKIITQNFQREFSNLSID